MDKNNDTPLGKVIKAIEDNQTVFQLHDLSQRLEKYSESLSSDDYPSVTLREQRGCEVLSIGYRFSREPGVILIYDPKKDVGFVIIYNYTTRQFITNHILQFDNSTEEIASIYNGSPPPKVTDNKCKVIVNFKEKQDEAFEDMCELIRFLVGKRRFW